jgi:hypothetical protein
MGLDCSKNQRTKSRTPNVQSQSTAEFTSNDKRPYSPLTPVGVLQPPPPPGDPAAGGQGQQDLTRGLGFVLDSGNQFARGPIGVPPPQQQRRQLGSSNSGAIPPAPAPLPPPHMLLPRSHAACDSDFLILDFLRHAQHRAAAAAFAARNAAEAEAALAALAGPESADYSRILYGSRQWQQQERRRKGSASLSSSSAPAGVGAVLADGPWPSVGPEIRAEMPRRDGGGGTGGSRLMPTALAGLCTDIMSTYPNMRVAERAANVYVMHRLMRWQLWPTERTYRLLPVWLRPSVSQIFVPHQNRLNYLAW